MDTAMFSTRVILPVFLLVSLAFGGRDGNLVHLNYALVFDADVSLGYQRSVAPKQAVGLLVEVTSSWTKGYQQTTVYASYNYYTRDNFFGWWIAPHIGVRISDKGYYLPIIPAMGYRWRTPRGLSFGVCLGLGPSIKLVGFRSGEAAVVLGALGIADIGYVF